MTEILESIDWKLVVAITALIIAAMTFGYAHWWRNRRRLEYQVIYRSKWVSTLEECRKDIEIFYKGERVEDVWQLKIKFSNPGFQPVKKDEFDRLLRHSLPQTCIVHFYTGE